MHHPVEAGQTTANWEIIHIYVHYLRMNIRMKFSKNDPDVKYFASYFLETDDPPLCVCPGYFLWDCDGLYMPLCKM